MSENHVSIAQVQQLIADGAELPYVVTDTLKAYEAKCAENRRLVRITELLQAALDRYLPCPDCRDKVATEECPRCARQALRVAYEAMKQERDAAIAGLEPFINGRVKHYAQRAEAAEATVARLTEALRDFGRHLDSCATRKSRVMNLRLGQDFAETLPPLDAVCNCGFGAALSASSTPDSNSTTTTI